MYKFIDRRRYKRMKSPSILNFRIKELKIESDIDVFEWKRAAVVDIGVGGALFYSNYDLGIESTLEIVVHLEKIKTLINCAGQVVRVEKVESPAMYLTAVVFSGMTEEDIETLNSVVEDFCNYAKKE